MARRKSVRGEEDKEPDLDISSLIDVCFLLLIYFIVTSTITPREQDLGMALPSASKGTGTPDIEPMLISVGAAGEISTGSGDGAAMLDTNSASRYVPLLDSQLSLYVAGAKSAGSKPMIQIYAHPESTQQRVIDVLNALAGQQISAVTFTDLTAAE